MTTITTMMTPQQAADYLGLRVQTLAVWRSAKRNALPYVRLGNRRIRYRVADLENWLNERTENTKQ